MLSLLLAAALLQASPEAAPASTDQPQPAPAAATSVESDTPRGAPAESYDFVAWCHGALTGHMALYEKVKPELVSIEQPGEVATDEKNDRLQLQAGRDYLALYTRALNGVDHGRYGALMTRRKAAEAQGEAIWAPYNDAPARARMWAYVGWDLPGRCETVAKAMETPAGRLAALHSPAPPPAEDDAAAGASAPKNIDDALGSTAAAPPNAPPASDAAPPLRGPQ